MRIKDLATRATKLLTGNAYMVFDNGTKVEKVDYAELAKQIITEYNTQTLAGSAQSVKSALDALNSKISGTMLWSGANAYDGDTITLSQPVTNFTWLLFMFRTNSEISTVLFRADHATSDRPYVTIQAGEWLTDDNRFQYCSWSSVTKTSATTYTVTCKYNNANFICRPLAIWGF